MKRSRVGNEHLISTSAHLQFVIACLAIPSQNLHMSGSICNCFRTTFVVAQQLNQVACGDVHHLVHANLSGLKQQISQNQLLFQQVHV
jgi:hypothetical protein